MWPHNRVRHSNATPFSLGTDLGSAPEWRSGIRHCVSVLEASLQTLVRFQAVSPWLGGAQLAQRRPGLASIVNKNMFLTDLPSFFFKIVIFLNSRNWECALFHHGKVNIEKWMYCKKKMDVSVSQLHVKPTTKISLSFYLYFPLWWHRVPSDSPNKFQMWGVESRVKKKKESGSSTWNVFSDVTVLPPR